MLKPPCSTISVSVAGHVVTLTHALTLANATEDLFKLAEGLREGECLVLNRQTSDLRVAQLKEANLLDTQEFLVVDRPRGFGRGGDKAGEA